MPQNKLQEFVFTTIMAMLMVYGMICYNVALSTGGFTNQTFVMALHEMPIMWPIAIVLELFVVGKLAPMLAFKIVRPADRPQVITFMISFYICIMMSPTQLMRKPAHEWIVISGTYILLYIVIRVHYVDKFAQIIAYGAEI